MAYVAVKGGSNAIEHANQRLKFERLKGLQLVKVSQIISNFRMQIGHAMSEASLYSKELAALAMKQAEGSLEETVFLLRAYRSTIPRKYISLTVETDKMNIKRRISASFKDIPGGQILGTTHDYHHRILDFDLLDESLESVESFVSEYMHQHVKNNDLTRLELPRVSDYLRTIGFLPNISKNDSVIKDITKDHLTFPTSRPERLQILQRGMTQAVIALGYASLRGYGSVHPTVGELRFGELPIYIGDVQDPDEQYYIGSIEATEVESFVPIQVKDIYGKQSIQFDIGYGFCFGQNETKAIAMSILDQTLTQKDPTFPTGNEEFVLLHVDSVEATGFISHLKLPHYVTFQSKLNDLRKKGK